ncbi:MAG: hypothetical protein HGB10_01365 [Coriobacteriia bacterium]|nr:hypothetical protein [Coriobacteriia bacterium]
MDLYWIDAECGQPERRVRVGGEWMGAYSSLTEALDACLNWWRPMHESRLGWFQLRERHGGDVALVCDISPANQAARCVVDEGGSFLDSGLRFRETKQRFWVVQFSEAWATANHDRFTAWLRQGSPFPHNEIDFERTRVRAAEAAKALASSVADRDQRIGQALEAWSSAEPEDSDVLFCDELQPSLTFATRSATRTGDWSVDAVTLSDWHLVITTAWLALEDIDADSPELRTDVRAVGEALLCMFALSGDSAAAARAACSLEALCSLKWMNPHVRDSLSAILPHLKASDLPGCRQHAIEALGHSIAVNDSGDWLWCSNCEGDWEGGGWPKWPRSCPLCGVSFYDPRT